MKEIVLFLFMRFKDYFRLIRVGDYIKNVIIFVPMVFAQKAGVVALWLPLLLTFLCFCLVSSFVYILNDISDRPFDRLHPRKCLRPIASGKILPGKALAIGMVFLLSGLCIAGFLKIDLLIVLFIYVAQNILYSLYLKKIIFLDVMLISFGFLLRVYSGGIISEVPISNWLYIMTVLLSLTISFGKRYDDLVLGDKIVTFISREMHAKYTRKLLLVMISATLTGSMLIYILYTFDKNLLLSRHPQFYFLTGMPVAAGLGRYVWRLMKKKETGSPLRLLYTDYWIIASVLIWTGMQLWYHL